MNQITAKYFKSNLKMIVTVNEIKEFDNTIQKVNKLRLETFLRDKVF